MKTGLSRSDHSHDLFAQIAEMIPGEYRNDGERLVIQYHFAQSPFGTILIASTQKGICSLVFADRETEALNHLRARFPRATFKEGFDLMQRQALSFFTHDGSIPPEITLHLKGTAFQINVWKALLKIPMSHLSTYKEIATSIAHPNAYRAVGTAIGSNPVAFLIPCHRVIQSSGTYGNYHWGKDRKAAMIAWEAAHVDTSKTISRD